MLVVGPLQRIFSRPKCCPFVPKWTQFKDHLRTLPTCRFYSNNSQCTSANCQFDMYVEDVIDPIRKTSALVQSSSSNLDFYFKPIPSAIVSPIDVSVLANYLSTHPNISLVNFFNWWFFSRFYWALNSGTGY